MIDSILFRFPVLRLRAAASAMRIGTFFVGLFIYSRLQAWPSVVSGGLFAVTVGVVTLRRGLDRFQAFAKVSLARKIQLHFDRRALQCMEAIGRGDEISRFRPIVLFLRPFAADRKLRFPNRAGADGFDPMPIECALANLCNAWCTTVTISNAAIDHQECWQNAFFDGPADPKKLFYVGPGEFGLPDSDWFCSVKQLAENADLVFFVPMDFGLSGAKAATFYELEYLFSKHMIEKCIFVMPAEQAVGHVRRVGEDGVIRSVQVTESLAALWEEGRKRLANSGIELPEFIDAQPGFSCFFGWPSGKNGPMTIYILDRPHWPRLAYEWMRRFGKRF